MTIIGGFYNFSPNKITKQINMSKPSIAIDMDEVLADPIDRFIQLYKRDYNLEITLDEMYDKEIYQILPPAISHKWYEYANEKGFFRNLKVIPDSQQIVQELMEAYDVFIVSSAMEFRNSLEDKYDWLAEHFPFIGWKNIMFCGQKIVNTDLMIDDRTKNFAHFAGRKLLFSSPHNLTIEGYERVDTWKDVAEKLL